MTRFTRGLDFGSLSLLDLVRARDIFHAQLANLPNVLGTAIGRYLIRCDDPRLKDPTAKAAAHPGERHIDYVAIAKWSWPCVIVFVEKWQETGAFKDKPEAYIPPRLYLPGDNRPVPTCVVAAPSLPRSERTIEQPNFATGQIPAGTAIMRDSQEQERIGTVACLVSDGADIYALTSGHVIAGKEDEELFGIDDIGHRRQVAHSTVAVQRTVPFAEAYPEWPGVRTYLNADVGMARITDVADWTARLVDGRRMGPVINLNVDTLNLDLIGCPVVGYGAASGQIKGLVTALFYRYRSIGGTDYIADIMIGPRSVDENVGTRPGDSGAIWLWDAAADIAVNQDDDWVKKAKIEPRPMAIQWGGYTAGGDAGPGSHLERQFALATSLSLACRLLNAEFISDLGDERGQYWGKTGHYKVAWSACGLVKDTFLRDLLETNRDKISVSDDDLRAGQVPMNNQKTFIALADVADLYWRSARPNDKANHFADMDNPDAKDPDHPSKKITLLEAWKTEATRTTDYWNRYYGLDGTDITHRGALPFRAWEVYLLLVEYARDAKLTEFLCAAGCVGHYLGDACQPLHVSYLHHGDPDNPDESPVHSTYETKMLDRFVNELVEGVNHGLQGISIEGRTFEGGPAAADHVVKTMSDTLDTLSPEDIIKVFNDNPGRPRLQKMWDELGDRTIACIVRGALDLAAYWESAWNEGRKDPARKALPATAPQISNSDLMELYRDKTFMPSNFISKMQLP